MTTFGRHVHVPVVRTVQSHGDVIAAARGTVRAVLLGDGLVGSQRVAVASQSGVQLGADVGLVGQTVRRTGRVRGTTD
jgi:hypothetical protein